MPRLGSKKSRNGCQQCKARRVKCDENRPCGNCARYRVECSLLNTAGPFSSNQTSPQSQPRSHSQPSLGYANSDVSNAPNNGTPSSQSPTPSNPSLPIAHASEYNFSPVSSQWCGGDWMLDLELMHHYTAHAFLTMPGVEQAKQTWGYAVPQEAFKHSFLMHSILAFSAYHIAHISPSRASQLRLLASTHQTAAINGLNQVLPDVTTINCHALFVGASLVTINAFADAGEYTLESLIEIFQLLRGMNFILSATEPLLEKGPFSVILKPLPNPPKPPPLLSSFLVELSTPNSAPDGTSINVSESCITATDSLREALQFGIDFSPHPALRVVMLWPIKLDTAFIDELRYRQDPNVSHVFRHYCRILEFAGTEWWFLAGWRNISYHI
ncbi:hypothetical protein BS50DRAFT_569941 [Corynespora cassiicola Philippines]|uniref:Zn(2)-C6 fungal-type domain-containing protein n=1 Tax=Corynespora cassiicola Philippines TaxID=1448308 RepID=A0A2T2P4B3_CORCC|nr:hypothetical protein BS50DRAFT_569941 [Corynespora cassiicola Philippines]